MDSSADNSTTGADGKPVPSQASNKRFQQTQAQVNEVVDIMRVNMEKVLERDAKLAQLDDRADALQAGASQFEASAGKLKNKHWWNNMKMTLIMGGVGLILVIALGWYIFGGKKTEEPAPAIVQAPVAGVEQGIAAPTASDLAPQETTNDQPMIAKPPPDTVPGRRFRRSAKLVPSPPSPYPSVRRKMPPGTV